jgi:hypothetical protein
MKAFLVLNLVNLICVFVYLFLLVWSAARALVERLRSWFLPPGMGV